MKISEIMQKIDKSKDNEVTCVDIEEVGNALDINVPYTEQDRLKAYWIANWYDTDTFVGSKMYFLDDEAVAISTQTGRKYDEDIQWLSIECASKVYGYLLELIKGKWNAFSVVDVNQDIGDHYTLSYNSELMPRYQRMFLNGEKVELIERIRDNPYGLDTEIIVQLPDGTQVKTKVNMLTFGFYLTE
jgi:hypothetical protein